MVESYKLAQNAIANSETNGESGTLTQPSSASCQQVHLPFGRNRT